MDRPTDDGEGDAVSGPVFHDRGDGYSFTCDHANPSLCVIETVAWLKGVEPLELEPLHTAVDVGALDALFSSPQDQLTVSFTFAGYDIHIAADKRITVHEPARAEGAELTSPSNVLVLDTYTTQYNEEVCSNLLSVEAFQDENVLRVTFSSSQTEKHSTSYVERDSRPANLGVLTAGGLTRSTSTHSHRKSGLSHIDVTATADPSDLSALGIQISEYLSKWRSNDNQTVVCFHSIDDLLAETNLMATVQFLSVLMSYIKQTDTIVHYHMDATAGDEQVIAVLEPLFDVVREYDERDGWTSRSESRS